MHLRILMVPRNLQVGSRMRVRCVDPGYTHAASTGQAQGSLVTPGGHSIVLWGVLLSFIYHFAFCFVILALDSITYILYIIIFTAIL